MTAIPLIHKCKPSLNKLFHGAPRASGIILTHEGTPAAIGRQILRTYLVLSISWRGNFLYPRKNRSVLVSGLRQNTASLNHSQQTTLRPRTVPPKLTTYQSVGNPNIASQLSMLMADFLCNEQKVNSNANRFPLRRNISQKFRNIL
jgi:hypothetical protein